MCTARERETRDTRSPYTHTVPATTDVDLCHTFIPKNHSQLFTPRGALRHVAGRVVDAARGHQLLVGGEHATGAARAKADWQRRRRPAAARDRLADLPERRLERIAYKV